MAASRVIANGFNARDRVNGRMHIMTEYEIDLIAMLSEARHKLCRALPSDLIDKVIDRNETGLPDEYVPFAQRGVIASEYLLSQADHHQGGDRPRGWKKMPCADHCFSTQMHSPAELSIVRYGNSPLWAIHRVRAPQPLEVLVFPFGPIPIFTRCCVSAMRLATHFVNDPPHGLCWINAIPNDAAGAGKLLIDEALREKNSAQLKGHLLHYVA